MRVDQNFSTSDTFFARYTIDNAVQNETQGDYSFFRLLGPRAKSVDYARREPYLLAHSAQHSTVLLQPHPQRQHPKTISACRAVRVRNLCQVFPLE